MDILNLNSFLLFLKNKRLIPDVGILSKQVEATVIIELLS